MAKEKMERELINRERELQRQEEDSRIFKAKYNRRYKDINVQNRDPSIYEQKS